MHLVLRVTPHQQAIDYENSRCTTHIATKLWRIECAHTARDASPQPPAHISRNNRGMQAVGQASYISGPSLCVDRLLQCTGSPTIASLVVRLASFCADDQVFVLSPTPFPPPNRSSSTNMYRNIALIALAGQHSAAVSCPSRAAAASGQCV
jgi:hypothetical protein